MFDLLEKRKNIEEELKELEGINDGGYLDIEDVNFLEAVQKINRDIFEIEPQKLKDHLEKEARVMKKLRKLHKKKIDDL